MKYYLFFLTKTESADGNKKGFGFAVQQRTRWIEVERCDELFTYDRGVSHIIHDNTAYHMYKDYMDFEGKYRVFVCEDKSLQSDNPDIHVS